jgi:hypothetical protein
MRVYLELQTDFGKFECEILEINEPEYMRLKDYAKAYHLETFEAFLQDGTYMVVPQAMLQHSQLFLRTIS